MEKLKKYLIPILCILNVVIHLLSFRYLEFHRDELLYFSLANHLDFGYASVPPLISWLAFLMKSIFGFSMFSVKVLPALLSGLFVYLGSRIAKELGGGHFAQILTIIALICSPVGLRAFILFQPVPFDIFFWTLIYFLILKYLNTEENKWLYGLGTAIGFALLNKHLVLLLLFSLLLVLPFTKYRTLFFKKPFYAALVIAFMIASPNIYWQLTNDTPLFTHLNALQATQLQFVSRTEFLMDQVLINYTSFFIALFGIFYLFTYEKSKQLWLFALSSLIVVFALFIMKGKAYYTAGIYPFLVAAGSTWIALKIKKIWKKTLIIAIVILLILPLFPMGIPFLPPKDMASYFDRMEEVGIDVGRVHENGNKYPLPQDFADMIGWYEIAALAKTAYEEVEDKKACAIYGENYGIAGAVSLINAKHGIPEAVSFSDSYAFWIPQKFEPDLTSLIYINDELGSDVAELFKDIKVIGQIDDPYSRQNGVTVYLCQNPGRSFNSFWEETVQNVFQE